MTASTELLWVVLTTVGDIEAGLKLVRHLVAEELVACAQILPPMVSVYRWEGQVQEETEHLILLKVPAQVYPQLEPRLQTLHPYTEPEIVCLGAAHISPTYLQWAIKQVRDPF